MDPRRTDPWWLDPSAWPADEGALVFLFAGTADKALRRFVIEHHVELGRLWRSLNRRDEGPAFGWYNCKPEQTREASFLALIRAALYFTSRSARIDSGDDWQGYLVTHVERVRTAKGCRDEQIERGKGVAALLVKRSLTLYGRPRVKLVRTLTRLTTGVQLSVDEVRWLARRAA